MIELLVAIGLTMTLMPVLSYLCVKMMVLGYLKAQQRFRELHPLPGVGTGNRERYPDNQENLNNGQSTREGQREST